MDGSKTRGGVAGGRIGLLNGVSAGVVLLILACATFLVSNQHLEGEGPLSSHPVLVSRDSRREEETTASLPPPVRVGDPIIRREATASLQLLESELAGAIEKVRAIRRETVDSDCHAPECWWQSKPAAAAAASEVQRLARLFMEAKYDYPLLVQADLKFPETMPDSPGGTGVLIWRMAPLEHAPYSVYHFLEHALARNTGGAFQRLADHVSQATVRSHAKAMAFQEYSPEWPHARYTLGYAGRPSHSDFYVSIVDNTRSHAYDRKGESDACFGALLMERPDVRATVDRMRLQPGGQKPMGFVKSKENYIEITSLRLLLGQGA